MVLQRESGRCSPGNPRTRQSESYCGAHNRGRLFFYVWISLTALAILDIIVFDGYPWQTLIWNGIQGGIYPDFFETIKDSRFLRPYDLKAVYPALVYVLFFPISRMIGAGTIIWEQDGDPYRWLQATDEQGAIIVASIFFIIITALLWYLLSKHSRLSSKQTILFLFVILLSPGYIFMIERGNIVVLATLLLAIFYAAIDQIIGLRES